MTPNRTASQIILSAAGTLPRTFTEWDLTIAAYKLSPERFAMRGHEQHPDHKKISCLVMGRKHDNVVTLGYLKRVAPNTYRVTDLGRAEIARLSSDTAGDDRTAILRLLIHPDFLSWRQTQERPARHTVENVEALLAIFRRYAGKFVTARPGTPGRRSPVTPQQVGEGLAFLEVLRAAPRKRTA